MSTRAFVLLLAGSSICCLQISSQTSPSPQAATQQVDIESTAILSSLQTDSAGLSPNAKQQEVERLNQALVGMAVTMGVESPPTNAVTILTENPSDLTLSQKEQAIDALIQAGQPQVQQVVIGGPQGPVNLNDPALLQPLADALNHLNLSDVPTLSSLSLAKLTKKMESIGKIVWAYQSSVASGSPMWQLAGTGFVSAPGVVTTACHVANEIADMSSGQPTLKSNIVVNMDFSINGAMQHPVRVSRVIAISSTAGCDAAQLAITDGDSIPALSVAQATRNTKRVIVVGYPLLDNYRVSSDCPTGSLTDIQFCMFAQTYPLTAKVASPGKVLTDCCDVADHGGVSVLTYNAPTDGGQSGSPVFDADTLEVVGIHYCCTGIVASSGGLLNCATWHPQNPGWNEAITTQSVLADSLLKGNFSSIASIANPAAASLARQEKVEFTLSTFATLAP